MKRILTVLVIGLSVVIGLSLTSALAETDIARQKCNSYKLLKDVNGTYLEDINSLDPISDFDKIICIVDSYVIDAWKHTEYAMLSVKAANKSNCNIASKYYDKIYDKSIKIDIYAKIPEKCKVLFGPEPVISDEDSYIIVLFVILILFVVFSIFALIGAITIKTPNNNRSITRKEFIIDWIVLFIVCSVLYFVLPLIEVFLLYEHWCYVIAVVIIPGYMARRAVYRHRNAGFSRKTAFLMLIPGLGLIWLIILIFLPTRAPSETTSQQSG